MCKKDQALRNLLEMLEMCYQYPAVLTHCFTIQ